MNEKCEVGMGEEVEKKRTYESLGKEYYAMPYSCYRFPCEQVNWKSRR